MPRDRSIFRAPCRRLRRSSKAGFANIRTSGCGCTAAGGDQSRPTSSLRAQRSNPRSRMCCSMDCFGALLLAMTTLASRLHLGPKPVDDTLRCGIARGDHEQFCKRRLVRKDVPVLENPGVDELLARQIAVGVGQKIRVLCGYLGPVEIIDQFVGFGDIPGVGGNREIVE